MEIDIRIENEHLDVGHSKDDATFLRLEDFIKIQKNKRNILWLDLKNLNNAQKCKKLNKILRNIKFENNEIEFFVEFPTHIIEDLPQYKKCIQTIKSMNFITSYYIPNDIKLRCTENNTLKISEINQCQYLENILEKLYESKLFTDISFDFKNYEILIKSNYIDKFILNTWHIPDEKILQVSNKNFRLVIPFNDDINYNQKYFNIMDHL